MGGAINRAKSPRPRRLFVAMLSRVFIATAEMLPLDVYHRPNPVSLLSRCCRASIATQTRFRIYTEMFVRVCSDTVAMLSRMYIDTAARPHRFFRTLQMRSTRDSSDA